jgi:Domain of unknown function (DUF4261)
MDERLISMVALSRVEKLEASRVRASLEKLGISKEYKFEFTASEQDEGVNLIITTENVSVAIILMKFPIPVDTLRTAVGGEVVWKDAGNAFLSSHAHILLSPLNSNADVKSLAIQSRILSLLTAAVADTYPALGIFWSSADYVIEPHFYLRQIPDFLRSAGPFPLWFNVRFYKGKNYDSDQKIVCQTRGLAVFMGRELECGPSDMQPGELAQTVLGVARYMVSSGPIFSDGHTFGFGKTESVDAQLNFIWSDASGVNTPMFQLELLRPR